MSGRTLIFFSDKTHKKLLMCKNLVNYCNFMISIVNPSACLSVFIPLSPSLSLSRVSLSLSHNILAVQNAAKIDELSIFCQIL